MRRVASVDVLCLVLVVFVLVRLVLVGLVLVGLVTCWLRILTAIFPQPMACCAVGNFVASHG